MVLGLVVLNLPMYFLVPIVRYIATFRAHFFAFEDTLCLQYFSNKLMDCQIL
jgi:hypothetical protein